MLRRHTQKSYSVFLAGARDCDKLRNAANEVIEEINKTFGGGVKS